MAAAAARNAATAGTPAIGEQYLGSALTAAIPGYPAVAANTYRALTRFAPYWLAYALVITGCCVVVGNISP